jgi:hypothetical protein
MVWHVVACSSGRTIAAAEAIAALGLEVCSPERVEPITMRGRRVERRVPWLGPLVLAKWASDDPHLWHDIRGLPDVWGIVGGWPPAVVPNSQVERLLSRIKAIEGEHTIEIPPCQSRDIVRFTWLAFHRLLTRCMWVCERDRTVGLRLEILGRETVLPIPWSAVEWTEPAIALGRRTRRRRNFGDADGQTAYQPPLSPPLQG